MKTNNDDYVAPATRLARCMLVTGSPAAAMLLYRLAVWKPARTHGKIRGIAKSHTELRAETGLSKHQVNQGIAKLKSEGWIYTAQHIFKGFNVMHVTLLPKAISALEIDPEWWAEKEGETKAQLSGKSENRVSAKSVTSYTSYKTLDTAIDTTMDSVLANAGPPGVAGKLFPKHGEVEEDMNPKKGKKAFASVTDALASATAKPRATKSSIVGQLENAWLEAVSAATSEYVAPLTMKQKGQLKHYAQICPQGTAESVLRYVVGHWLDFAAKVQTDAGWKTVAYAPSLDFLLKHAAIAVNLWLSENSPEAQQKVKVQGFVMKPKVQLMSQPPKPAPVDKPKTKAEALAMWDEDD